jgi:acyl-CoA synthetase (NDP forming)
MALRAATATDPRTHDWQAADDPCTGFIRFPERTAAATRILADLAAYESMGRPRMGTRKPVGVFADLERGIAHYTRLLNEGKPGAYDRRTKRRLRVPLTEEERREALTAIEEARADLAQFERDYRALEAATAEYRLTDDDTFARYVAHVNAGWADLLAPSVTSACDWCGQPVPKGDLTCSEACAINVAESRASDPQPDGWPT